MDKGTVKTTGLVDRAATGTLTIGMKIKIEGEVEVKERGSLQIIEEEVEIIFQEGNTDNGMVMTQVIMTEIIGTVIMTVRTMVTGVGDQMAIEAKVTVREDGEEDVILISNTLSRMTHPNTHLKVIIGPLPWVVSTNTKYPRTSTQPTHNHNNITCRDHPHNCVKQQTFVSCAKTKAIMIINANLQVTSWPEPRKR